MSPTSDIKPPDVKQCATLKPETPIEPSPLGAMCYTRDTEQVVVMPDEDRQLYHLHLQSFRDQYQPQGPTEEHLVQSLADVSWRINRVVALETNILSYSYAPRDLMDGRFNQTKALANLSMHTQRLSRQFERTVALLRDLQKIRRAQQPQGSKGETRVPSTDGFVFFNSSEAAPPNGTAMRQHADRRETIRI